MDRVPVRVGKALEELGIGLGVGDVLVVERGDEKGAVQGVAGQPGGERSAKGCAVGLPADQRDNELAREGGPGPVQGWEGSGLGLLGTHLDRDGWGRGGGVDEGVANGVKWGRGRGGRRDSEERGNKGTFDLRHHWEELGGQVSITAEGKGIILTRAL